MYKYPLCPTNFSSNHLKLRWISILTGIQQRRTETDRIASNHHPSSIPHNNPHHQRRRWYASGKKSSSYGPILKDEGPSSRKAWRDDPTFRDMIQTEQQRARGRGLGDDDDDDDENDHDDNVMVQKERMEEDTDTIHHHPSWLVRLVEAQFQYPTMNRSVIEHNHNIDNHNKSRTVNELRAKSKKTSKHMTATNTNQHHRRNKHSMILTIPQLEIRTNIRDNIQNSVHSYKGTGHAIIGLNGSGKSLLLRALLHPPNNITTTTSHTMNTTHFNPYRTSPSTNNMKNTTVTSNRITNKDHNVVEEMTAPSTIDHRKERHDDHLTKTTDDDDDDGHVNKEAEEDVPPVELPPALATASPDNPYLIDASKMQFQSPNPNNQPISIAYVSFESHQDLLDEARASTKPTTVWSVLTKPMGGGQLSQGLQYLVVRFGLYSLLTHDITTLSTGEIRKLLLIRAIGQKPNLLILDNAFDGLDVPSRQTLDGIITKTMTGFQKSDILVQGVNVKSVVTHHGAHSPNTTQIVLLTHRPEEIHNKIARITFLRHPSSGLPSTTENRSRRTGKQLLLECAGYEPLELGLMTPKQFARQADDMTGLYDDPWYDTTLPSDEDILQVWWNNSPGKSHPPDIGTEIITARYFKIRNATDTKNLISDLNWKVKYGERWWLSGLNGAGKSTLSQHIISTTATKMDQINTSASSSSAAALSPSTSESDTMSDESFFQVLLKSSDVSYISTNLHMSFAKSQQCGRDVIEMLGILPSGVEFDGPNKTVPSYETIKNIMKWLNLPKSFLTRPFNELSQGEQKMLLIAGVLSYRPVLLVLDEPLQGLDIVNRHRVLGVVDRICSVTNISLIYVTHHYEDLIPALTHVLHLVKGKSTFKGTVETFDCHNTLWSNKIKPVPKDELSMDEEEEDYDTKKKRKRRVW